MEFCQSFFYSPIDAKLNCLKNSFNIYIKINTKTAPTCFGAVTPSSGSALFVLAKVTVVNTMRTGDADLRFYVTTVQDGDADLRF